MASHCFPKYWQRLYTSATVQRTPHHNRRAEREEVLFLQSDVGESAFRRGSNFSGFRFGNDKICSTPVCNDGGIKAWFQSLVVKKAASRDGWPPALLDWVRACYARDTGQRFVDGSASPALRFLQWPQAG